MKKKAKLSPTSTFHEAQDGKSKISFFEERTIKWDHQNDSITLIDQTMLPLKLEFIRCGTVEDLIRAIKTMQIRGAPAIGVAGAMGVALSVLKSKAGTKSDLLKDIQNDCIALKSSRPTAVNLAWGVDRAVDYLLSEIPEEYDQKELKKKVIEFVEKLADKDVETNKRLSEIGSKLIRSGDRVLTHCN